MTVAHTDDITIVANSNYVLSERWRDRRLQNVQEGHEGRRPRGKQRSLLTRDVINEAAGCRTNTLTENLGSTL